MISCPIASLIFSLIASQPMTVTHHVRPGSDLWDRNDWLRDLGDRFDWGKGRKPSCDWIVAPGCPTTREDADALNMVLDGIKRSGGIASAPKCETPVS